MASSGADFGAPGTVVAERRIRLAALETEALGCTRCPQLVAGRTQVVFGTGDPDAELMFVGEAPGVREDAEGVPFAGSPGRLLDELLASIGMRRDQVYVAHVLKCWPPGNRDPAPAEIVRCRPYLEAQIALVEPRVICTLGDFATKLLRGTAAAGIKQRHGQAEVVVVGTRAVHLLPLFHPAAALYTRALRATLEADLARLPELLARPAPRQPEQPVPVAPPQEGGTADVVIESGEETGPGVPTPGDATPSIAPSGAGDPPQPPPEPAGPPDGQLGLF